MPPRSQTDASQELSINYLELRVEGPHTTTVYLSLSQEVEGVKPRALTPRPLGCSRWKDRKEDIELLTIRGYTNNVQGPVNILIHFYF